MASKIKKVVEEVVEEIEGVVVRFLGHVRHNGKDYHPGDTAEIAADSAATLTKLGVAQPVVAEAPAPANGVESNTPAKGDEAGQAAAADPAEPAEASADAAASAGA